MTYYDIPWSLQKQTLILLISRNATICFSQLALFGNVLVTCYSYYFLYYYYYCTANATATDNDTTTAAAAVYYCC
jgi:hypothetical protein